MKAVCLDMDGTLVDSERLWDVAVYEIAEHMGRPLDAETRRRTLGSSMRGFFEILSEYTGHPVDTDEEFFRLSARLGDRVAELFATELEWRPGARELLADLEAAGLPLALVTNTDADIAVAPIDFIGRDRFDAIVTGDEVALPKPEPDPYLLACERLGVAPEDSVAVEDSVTGATSAAAAGCHVLYVPSRDDQPSVPGTVVRGSLLGLDARALAALTTGETTLGAVGESRP